jgi:hypothetical protein
LRRGSPPRSRRGRACAWGIAERKRVATEAAAAAVQNAAAAAARASKAEQDKAAELRLGRLVRTKLEAVDWMASLEDSVFIETLDDECKHGGKILKAALKGLVRTFGVTSGLSGNISDLLAKLKPLTLKEKNVAPPPPAAAAAAAATT